jgi:plasmid stabilization system protein ParE
MRSPVLSVDVRQDLIEAYAWYEKQNPGLGDRFLAAVKTTIFEICKSPEIHGFVLDDIRATLADPFPYVVYYRMLTDDILVIAVLHGARDDASWKDRV